MKNSMKWTGIGLLFILAGLSIFYPSNGFTTETTATFGDANSSGQYRAKADSDGVITFAPDTGINYPYENYTAANTANALALTECGKVITDTGSASGPTVNGQCSKHTLPRATPGCGFTFTTGAKNCRITVDTVDTSDTILYSISGTGLDAGDSIKAPSEAGDSVKLFSTVANKWSIEDMHGTWTDNGTN